MALNVQPSNLNRPKPKTVPRPGNFFGEEINHYNMDKVKTAMQRDDASDKELTAVWENFLGVKEENANISVETQKTSERKSLEIGGMKEISFKESKVIRSADQRINQQADMPTNRIAEPAEPKSYAKSVKSGEKWSELVDFWLLWDFLGKCLKWVWGQGKDFKKAMFSVGKDSVKPMMKFKFEEKKDEKKDEKKKPKFTSPIAGLAKGLNLDRMLMIKKQRADVNKKLNLNEAFEGSVDENGQIREDIQAALDKLNSQMQEAEIRRKKQAAAQRGGPKGKKKPHGGMTEMNKATENSSHVTKQIG